MSDTLCDLHKLLRHDFDAYCQLIDQPRFVCRHCGRAANKKKSLCEPKKIHESADPDADNALSSTDGAITDSRP